LFFVAFVVFMMWSDVLRVLVNILDHVLYILIGIYSVLSFTFTPQDYLLDVLNSNSEFGHALRTVLTQSVVQKLADVGSTNAVDKYTTLLSACAADGVVNEMEKKLLRDYASSHHINEDMHNACLQNIGWTPEEFHQGMKKTTEGERCLKNGEETSGGKTNEEEKSGKYWANKAFLTRGSGTNNACASHKE
jgi:hypothetical protein